MEKDYLILKRASASRSSGEWNDNDYDVLPRMLRLRNRDKFKMVK